MAKYKLGVAALLGAAIISVGAGCGGSDPKEAETPASAVTVSKLSASPFASLAMVSAVHGAMSSRSAVLPKLT